MWITIYTDASFKDGVSKGAYWIKSDLRRIVESCSLESNDNNLAELEVACKAIFKAVQTHASIPKVSGILLVTDNMFVITCLKFGAKFHRIPQAASLQKQVNDLGIKIRLKHVKGHSGTNTRPKWLNNKVDKLAKNHNDKHNF